ncbi:hypothetical protein [Planomicrobium sp. CPCC 101079]|uniref:hypothetical protein n=1 Tax=Planomicrobium sp. CPCC 101079 TaxID=2599618 RepID=UPI0011B69AF4|nr:hypothetical protein [Planomicrobium sp. CPCC 101079]TWT00593.1 hypothetical protein FQV28_17965 [Planomicrobium sp. CPCC 101079]
MSITCKINEVESIQYRFKEFDLEGNIILNELGNEENEIEVKNPLNLIDGVNVFPCETFIFYNKNFSESNIYQVYEKEERIRVGWIFPLQALISKEHKYAENVYFLNYAYMALFNFFVKEGNTDKSLTPNFREDGIYTIEDFYDVENIQVLILSSMSLNKVSEFCIEDYYLDLYRKGYYLKKYDGEKEVVQADETIKISKISADMKSDPYPVHLFTDVLIAETHLLVRFHLLYQVIELIIDKIFNKELKSILVGLGAGEKKLSQIKDEFNELSKENNRIKKLFTEHISNNSLKSSLKDECNKLLLSNGRDGKGDSGLSLYGVRNLIVHDYRSISPTDYELIKEINYLFEEVVIDILISIKNLD